MPRNEPLKDPVAHSERQVRGEHKPHDPVALSEEHTKHSVADWEKRKAAGDLAAHQQAPPAPPAPVEKPIEEEDDAER